MIRHQVYTKQDLSIQVLRLRRWLRRLATPRARSVPAVYVAGSLPMKSGRICLFVTYAPTGRLSAYVQKYIEALTSGGFAVIVIAVMDNLNLSLEENTFNKAELVMKRKNVGFDFAAWSSALSAYPELWDADELLFVNDSVYPMIGNNFKKTLEYVCSSKSDVQALVESKQRGRHFQSYFFCLKRKALSNPAVKKFWGDIRNFREKDHVINNYEIKQLKFLEKNNLNIDIAYPYYFGSAPNPSIFYWKELIRNGFPFIKVQLLRNEANINIMTGWPEEVLAAGGEIDPIEKHLNDVAPSGSALRILAEWRAINEFS